MPLMEPDFVSIEEAVRRLETSLETLKWNIEKGHVRVYIKTPTEHKMYPTMLPVPAELHRYARVENVSHWDQDKQERLFFRRLVLLDITLNEIEAVDSLDGRSQADLFIYLPEHQPGGQEEQKADTPPKLSKRLFEAREQMRVWLKNGRELSPSKYADKALAMPKFTGLKRRTLIAKAREMLTEEGREDLIRKNPGRPPKSK